jgi:hypothetical protein
VKASRGGAWSGALERSPRSRSAANNPAADWRFLKVYCRGKRRRRFTPSWLNGVPKHGTTGSTVFFPGGAPHTFFVESEVARVLVLSTPAGIEQFVRALSGPAKERRLPHDDEENYPDREGILRRSQLTAPQY